MKRFFKTLKWLVLAFFLLLLVAAGLLYFKRDAIKNLVIQQASAQLTAPVEVAQVDISLRKFPSAAIHLQKVFSKGLPKVGTDTLIYADDIFLQFDLWRLITGHIAIDKISIENGSLHLKSTAEGLNNFEIWEKSSSEKSSVFQISELALREMQLRVQNETSQLDGRALLHSLKASGSFDSTQFNIQAATDLHLTQLTVEKQSHLKQKASIQTDLSLKGNSQSWQLNSSKVLVNNSLAARLQYIKEGKSAEFLAWLAGQNLEQLAELNRAQNFVALSVSDLQGEVTAEYRLQLPENADPISDLSFQAKQVSGKIASKNRILPLNLEGSYHRSSARDELIIEKFAFSENEGEFSGQLKINNLKHPVVEASLLADMPVSKWLQIIPLDTLTKPVGTASANLSFRGRFNSLQEITAQDLDQSHLSGNISFKNAGFGFSGTQRAVEDLNGKLNLENTSLKIERLFFSSGQSDLYLQGYFGNVLNFLFFTDQNLVVNTRVKSQEIVLDEFIQTTNEEQGQYSLDFIKNLDLKLLLEVDKFSFGNFRARQLKGNLAIRNDEIVANDLTMQADGGSYAGNFIISPAVRDSGYILRAKLQTSNIAVNSVFKSFNNFNQQTITALNLKGKASVNANLSARMNNQLKIDPASIDLVADLMVKDGHLKNYEPLKALSNFAELKELEDVEFSTLENTITIHQSVITIPDMNIQSNVLNLQLSGTHDFENNIDYLVKLRLSDVLFSKRSAERKKSEFDDHLAIAQRKDDHLIPVSIKGSIKNPEIAVTGGDLGQALGQDLKKQGQDLKNIFKKDSADKAKSKTGIIFEWDEG